ncbi:hypothetical protein NLU13_1258 [Sarocladium strictum]|uniref:Alpha/beta hydrolase fold-3 domain-containing protein n=1 Tax=Sarocladium strictum TaxID=5046 RepID=A0AA39LCA9_SARSR|nr:hypothetical protein NLU13_1258 [Sarocladium strictum]
MSDFSAYGGIHEEWVAAEKANPVITVVDMTVEEKKRAQNEAREKVAAEGLKALRSKVTMRDHGITCRDGHHIEARTYRPSSIDEREKLPVYIHFHGGGFMTGTLASEDTICAGIAIGAGVMVLNVNYRHTPEHGYPTAWDDAEDAFEWLHDNIDAIHGDAQAVVIGGISAGAWLTASLVLRKHLGQSTTSSRPSVAGQVLMIPCVTFLDCFGPLREKLANPRQSSYEENADAPILPLSIAKEYNHYLKVENPDPNDLRLNPGHAKPEQVAGLPPTVFGIAGRDILRDEGLLYAKMLAEAGVPTDVNVYKGVPHGFRRLGAHMPTTASRWDRTMVDGIKWALSKPRASGRLEIKAE